MNHALQTAEQNKIDFKQETVDLIRKTVATDLTPVEFNMFMYQARRSGLDPMARQIYAIKRAGKTNIQASIDGLRLVAQRSGAYAGQDEPVFEGDPRKLGFNAKVTVYRFSPQGQRYPAAVGVAYWEEYCPKEGQDFMWQKMPRTMLAKVAEALALRKAFPQELSGIYTTEEMEQAQPISASTVQPTIAKEEEAVEADIILPSEDLQPESEDVSDELLSEIFADDEVLKCQECHKPLSKRELEFSKTHCYTHQKRT